MAKRTTPQPSAAAATAAEQPPPSQPLMQPPMTPASMAAAAAAIAAPSTTGRRRGRPRKTGPPPVNSLSTTDPALLDPVDPSLEVASAQLAPADEEIKETDAADFEAQAIQAAQAAVEEEAATQNNEHFEDAVDQQDETLLSPGIPPVGPAEADVPAYSASARDHLSSKREELLDVLPETYGRANDILRILAPITAPTEASIQDILSELGKDTNKRYTRLLRLRPQFEESFKDFAHLSPFIDRDLLLHSLLEVDALDMLSAGPGRPDDLVYKANLAELMYQLVVELSPDSRLMFLQQLENDFPRQFLAKLGDNAITPGGSFVVQQCFEASIAIKTQLAIARVHSEMDDFEPDAIFTDVFGLDRDDPRNGKVRSWDPSLFMQEQGNLVEEYDRIVKETFQKFSPYFNGGSDQLTVDTPAIAEAHPWTDFLCKVGAWAAARNIELEQNVAKKSGPDMIMSHLRAGNYRRLKLTTSDMRAGGARAMLKVRARRNMNRAKPQVPPTAPHDGASLDNTDAVGSGPDANAGAMADADAEPANIPRRLFADPQPGATILTFDETQLDDLATAQTAVEVSQDDGFESAGGTANAFGKRPREAVMRLTEGSDETPVPSPAKKQRRRRAPVAKRTMEPTTNQFEHEEQEQEQQQQQQQQQEQAVEDPGQSAGHDNWVLVDTPPSTGIENATERTNQAANKPIKEEKEPQKRKAWSDEETDTLLWYVARYGPKWAEIKKADNGLHFADRGQVALKDKARNIIRQCLKNHEPIPTGLEDYNLPANMKAELRALGIDPDARNPSQTEVTAQ